MATPASTHRPALFYWSYSSTVLVFYCSTATAVPGELHMGPDTVLSREAYWGYKYTVCNFQMESRSHPEQCCLLEVGRWVGNQNTCCCSTTPAPLLCPAVCWPPMPPSSAVWISTSNSGMWNERCFVRKVERDGLVVRIPGSHPGSPGPIPGNSLASSTWAQANLLYSFCPE